MPMPRMFCLFERLHLRDFVASRHSRWNVNSRAHMPVLMDPFAHQVYDLSPLLSGKQDTDPEVVALCVQAQTCVAVAAGHADRGPSLSESPFRWEEASWTVPTPFSSENATGQRRSQYAGTHRKLLSRFTICGVSQMPRYCELSQRHWGARHPRPALRRSRQ